MTQTDPQHQAERFDRVYRHDDQTYGAQPSGELIRYEDQCVRDGGRALDLAAGLGRDTLALARAVVAGTPAPIRIACISTGVEANRP